MTPKSTGSETLGFRRRSAVALSLILGGLASTGALFAQTECADCHEAAPTEIEATVHSGFDCSDCHAGFDEDLHPEEAPKAGCSDCHEDVIVALAASVHGQSPGTRAAKTCGDCHGSVHRLVGADDPRSPIHLLRLAGTCGRCHSDPEIAQQAGFHLVRPLEAYEGSVHAQALRDGLDAPTCSDCHGGHDIQETHRIEAGVSFAHVPEQCGTCHGDIAAAYRASVHGVAAAEGLHEAPVCTDCHGEHHILSPKDRGSRVFATNIPRMTCGRCHGDLTLSEKYGLDVGAVASYRDSYHGLATRAGAVAVANCASCHGIHDILPSSDPASHIHESNMAETCGACHPGAGRRFAIGPVHVLPTEPEHAALFWIRRLYLLLIFLTIGGMVLHNLADLTRKAHSPELRQVPVKVVSRERLTVAFRIAHFLLLASFLLLVWTGFALTYPESWWARPLLQWEGEVAFRGLLHRLAAVGLLVATFFHLVHLVLSHDARRTIRHMLPERKDWRELVARIGYFLGRREAPRPRVIGYAEKLEYLAVVWGTALMTVTGFVLWFDNLVLRWLPKWVIDVATVIHFYEAVLASLAILVWHFYFVLFDPLVYPMDPAWLNGRSAPGRAHERRGR